MQAFEIEAVHNKFTKKFNLELNKYFTKKNSLLNESINYSIMAGGKRFRPFLIYIFSKAFNISTSTSIKIGISVEMLHNYSLVHDDLPAMDNDNYRRGKKTTHFKYNEYIAILAGCGLLTMSYQVLSSSIKVENKKKIALITRLTEISGDDGLLKGQFEDLSSNSIKYQNRIRINKLKTGLLMSYCTEAVGIIAGRNKLELKLLRQVGLNIGEIFQISDDFNDEPKMSTKEKKYLIQYRLQIFSQTLRSLKKLGIKNNQVYDLLDYLMELKV